VGATISAAARVLLLLWPRSILQPPLTQADQRALIDLAKQEERRPEQAINVQFTPHDSEPDADGHAP
jgi:hypothetical protein